MGADIALKIRMDTRVRGNPEISDISGYHVDVMFFACGPISGPLAGYRDGGRRKQEGSDRRRPPTLIGSGLVAVAP